MVHLETDLDDNQVDDDELELDLSPLGHDGNERLGLVGEVVQLAVEDDDPLGDVQRLRDVLVDLLETGLAPVDVGRLDKLGVEVELPAEKQQAAGELERVLGVDGNALALRKLVDSQPRQLDVSLDGLLENGESGRAGDSIRERQHVKQLLLRRLRVQADDLRLRRHMGVCCVGAGARLRRQLHVVEVLGLVRVRVYLGVLEKRNHLTENLLLFDVPRHYSPELEDKHVLLLVLEQYAFVGHDLDRRNPLQRQL